MKDKVIVNWSSFGREAYPQGQLKLIRSIKDAGWDGDIMMRSYDGWCDEYLGVKIKLGEYPQSKDFPLNNNHAEIPYGFKPAMIQEAREAGYRFVVWMDATMRLLKDPQEYLNLATIRGVVAFDNLGHPLRRYISDFCLARLGIDEGHLDGIKQIMCCCQVWDFNHPVAVKVFEEWINASHDSVSFQNYTSGRSDFITHRHDQACLSGVLWKHNVELEPYGGLAYCPHEETKEYGEVTFLNKGV